MTSISFETKLNESEDLLSKVEFHLNSFFAGNILFIAFRKNILYIFEIRIESAFSSLQFLLSEINGSAVTLFFHVDFFLSSIILKNIFEKYMKFWIK